MGGYLFGMLFVAVWSRSVCVTCIVVIYVNLETSTSTTSSFSLLLINRFVFLKTIRNYQQLAQHEQWLLNPVVDLRGGGTPVARHPSTGQNFFNFMGFFRKSIKYIGSAPQSEELVSPPMTSVGSAPGIGFVFYTYCCFSMNGLLQ